MVIEVVSVLLLVIQEGIEIEVIVVIVVIVVVPATLFLSCDLDSLLATDTLGVVDSRDSADE